MGHDEYQWWWWNENANGSKWQKQEKKSMSPLSKGRNNGLKMQSSFMHASTLIILQKEVGAMVGMEKAHRPHGPLEQPS